MQSIKIILTFIFNAALCLPVHADVVDFADNSTQVIPFNGRNSIPLTLAVQKIFNDAIRQSPGRYITAEIKSVMTPTVHVPRISLTSKNMWVSGFFQACEIPENLRKSESVFDAGKKSALNGGSLSLNEVIARLARTKETVDTAMKHNEAVQAAFEKCAVRFGSEECLAVVSWEGYFSATTFNLRIEPSSCPALASLTEKTGEIYLKPISETSMEFSDVNWK